MTQSQCPCGSSRPYAACCEPFHGGGEPPDATSLMRSRYAAFVRGEHRYLFRTLHPEHEDHTLYSSHTIWQGKAAFEAWTRSEEFRAVHRDAGQSKPLYLDHPQFEGFEVLQTVAA